MNVATIDLGTNTLLALIARRGEDGAVCAVHEEMRVVRLGEGVDRTRRFAPAAIARTVAALEELAPILAAHDVTAVRAVATSAMRDAEGAAPIHEAFARHLGATVEIISGAREAELTFRGALSGLTLPAGPVVVFDVGGGSTEVVLGTPGGPLGYAQSFDVGSVRLTERHLAAHADPPPPAAIAEVRAAARALLAPLLGAPPAAAAAAPLVGIAGTVTTLVAVAGAIDPYDGARVHGALLDRPTLSRCIARFSELPQAARAALPGLSPKRADVILAGALVVEAVMDALGRDRLTASDRGVRWGLAAEALSA